MEYLCIELGLTCTLYSNVLICKSWEGDVIMFSCFYIAGEDEISFDPDEIIENIEQVCLYNYIKSLTV